MEAEQKNQPVDKPLKQHHGKPGKSQQYVRHKRPPKRVSRRPNDIYVNRTSQFGQQLARCRSLLDQSFDSLTIHGLGTAIHRAINLALQLQETSSVPLDLTVATSTVQLVDDLEPVDDDTDYHTQTRPSSAIHIQVSKLSPTLPPPSSSSAAPSPPAAAVRTDSAKRKDGKS